MQSSHIISLFCDQAATVLLAVCSRCVAAPLCLEFAAAEAAAALRDLAPLAAVLLPAEVTRDRRHGLGRLLEPLSSSQDNRAKTLREAAALVDIPVMEVVADKNVAGGFVVQYDGDGLPEVFG